MLLDGSQPQQSLVRRDRDGSSSSEQTRSVNDRSSQSEHVKSNASRSSQNKDRGKASTAKKRKSKSKLDAKSAKEVKYIPPLCHYYNTCKDVRIRVITVKRVNSSVVRYCKCPHCGRTSKIVEPFRP